MADSFKAILLKKLDYGENNIILQTYTREHGSVSFFTYKSIAKGKRKVALTPLSILEITASKGKGEMLRTKEILTSPVLGNLLTDVHKSCLVMFINEVLIKAIREYHEDKAMFDFISDALMELDESRDVILNFHLTFILELTRFLGFYPGGKYSQEHTYFDLHEGIFTRGEPLHSAFIPPEDCIDFANLMNNRHLNDDQLKLTNERRRKLLAYLLDYYRIHVAKFDQLKSTEVLEQILN